MGHKSLYLAGEQRLGEHVAGVVDVFALCRIPYCYGHVCSGGSLYFYGNGFEGAVVTSLHAGEVHVGVLEPCRQIEAEPVGIHASLGVEHRYLIYSGSLGIHSYWVAVRLREVFQHSVVHNGNSKFFLRCAACRGIGNAYACGVRADVQRHAIRFCLGQFFAGGQCSCRVPLAVCRSELCRQRLPFRRSQFKHASATVQSFGSYCLAVWHTDAQCAFQSHTLLVPHLPCHTLLQPRYKAASFREELYGGAGLLCGILVIGRQGAQGHVLGEVPR